MNPEFWHERWRIGQIGFHQPAVDRHLIRHWPDLGLATNGRVFVPLCGKSLDLLWLRDRGHRVSGVELSAVAIESLCMQNGILASRRNVEAFDVYESANLTLYQGDFFTLSPALVGPIAAVYDRAALISWDPQLREAYVEHAARLTTPGTQTLLVTMEYPQSQMTGPPFSVTVDDVARLYAGNHSIQELSREDTLAREPRLRARGLTQLHEVCYRLIRLH